MGNTKYPKAESPELVGTYPALAKAGGGYVWDAVLEYRVWCYPDNGAEDLEDGNDYYYSFADYSDAYIFSKSTEGSRPPLALVRQDEYLDEPEPDTFIHIKAQRIAEWPVEFLSRPKRIATTIPDFLASDAPANRLDILRGIASSDENEER